MVEKNKKNRNQIIQDLFQNIGLFHRLMFAKGRSGSVSKTLARSPRFGVLLIVSRHNASSIKEIAEHFGITSSAVTQLVDSLVEEKLLKRVPNSRDRRKISITLTNDGKLAMEEAKKERVKIFEKILEPLSDKELGQYHTLQEKIVGNIK